MLTPPNGPAPVLAAEVCLPRHSKRRLLAHDSHSRFSPECLFSTLLSRSERLLAGIGEPTILAPSGGPDGYQVSDSIH
jgi:hypothetical protein